MKDTPEKYGFISRTLHHIIALLMIFQFLKLFENWNDKQNPISQMLPPWHGSIGAILLIFITIRIIWTLSQIRNRHSESFLAKAGHILLYVFMFFAPVTAICLMLAKGYGVKVFGTSIISSGNAIPSLLPVGELHGPISVTLCVLVIGHVGMALYHQFIKKEKLLQKMFA